MIARTSDLYDREVICVKEGIRLGTVGDVEINTATGNAESIVVFGKRKLFGLFGGGEDLVYLRGRYASPHQESADGEGKFVYQP